VVEGFYPENLFQALNLLKTKENSLPVSGGTDIMVVGKSAPNLIFLNRIPELKEIKETKGTVSIGAGCVYTDLLHEERIPEILRTAISQIAAPAIRNAGTIGGNICNASPAGDTLPVLYALSAEVVKASLTDGQTITTERIPISEFIPGIRRIALGPEEIAVCIEIPKAAYEHVTKTYYQKVGARNAQAISKLSFAALMNVEHGIVTDVRIAFGSVGVTALRMNELENKIIGMKVNDLAEKKADIVAAYAEQINPISDQRSTAIYRKKVCLNLLSDFLTV